MSYNIYTGTELQISVKDYMTAVAEAVAYYRGTDKPVTVMEVALDGTETPYNWERAYRELCNG